MGPNILERVVRVVKVVEVVRLQMFTKQNLSTSFSKKAKLYR
jgi:hypothetical protein